MPSPTPTQTHNKKPKPALATSPAPTPAETISESAALSEPATPSAPVAPETAATAGESAVPDSTPVAPETAATAGESAVPDSTPATNPDLSSNSEDSNLAWWIMGILVLAALVGGGGLVARSRGRQEAIPMALTPGGAGLASAPATTPAQTPPTPRQQPEGELSWDDLGEQDRAKFEQAIRDFGLES